jgi:PKD repeat protein
MRKQYKLLSLLSFIMLAFVMSTNAQINLAPSATATCNTTQGSTTTGGGWNWTQINNGTISGCGNQEAFIWTGTPPASTDEMTWTWSSAKSINKFIFYNAMTSNPGRTMTGCTVQYWNGSSWVNWYITANNAIREQCIDSITFPTVTTTAIRLTNIKMVTTGQQSNPNWREIQIISGPSVNNDAGVSAMGPLDFCSNNQALSAKLFNFGKFRMDSVRLYWSINGVNQTPRYITSSLAGAKDTTIMLNSSYTFTNNTTYKFKLWTSNPNGTVDSVAANDTLNVTLNFFGNPPAPTTTNYIQCGVGQPLLQATTGVNSDTIMWYKNSSGGSPIGMGKSFLGPKISATTTFYAQAYRFAAKNKLNNGYSGNIVVSFNYAAYNGNYFDVSTTSPLNVDSITFRVYLNNATTNYQLYYKTGTFSGFETNSSAWTMINQGGGRFFSTGGQNFLKVSAKDILLSPNQTYGFYFTVDPTTGGGNDIYMKGSTALTSNGDMTIVGGKYGYGLFGATSFGPTYTIDCEFSYSKACVNPSRSPLTVTVKPRPIGADVTKGSPFQGQFRVGDVTKPDVAEVGKPIVYELSPPAGFTNAGHGSTWVVNNVIARTRYNVIVPATEYTVSAPSSSGPGTVSFTPKTFYLDSFITFSVNFSDLGPYFCDSTVKRTVVVAPTPRPNFKFPASICLGDAVLFDNVTTIHSGNATYTWYFGNGDSSDLQSPVYEYKAPGTYTVKLIAKSFPWNVLHDTSITLEVGELPTTLFRVNNKCQGLPVTFVNQTFVANGALTYDWDFGDGTPHSTSINPSHLYSTPGGYKVTLKATANGCVSTLIKSAYMFARPVANFAAPLAPICAKTEVLLPNTSTIALGEQGAYWTFGDGGGSTLFDGSHAYTGPGTYSVKLLAVSEFDCKDSITKTVTIKPTPNPDFAGNQFCGKIPTVFTNKTVEALANPIYNWTFSDNFTSALKNVTRTWPYEGPFSATLKASYSNGCEASTTKEFTILMQPKADFSVQNICSGEIANFVNKSNGDRGGIQYEWDFGNSTTSNLPAPTRLYNPTVTTTYTVTLVASYPAACSDTVRKTLTVSESPICDFTFKDLGMKNVKFTPTNTGYTKYEWFFGEGGTSSSISPNYEYAYTGNFNVTMKATNIAGCTCEVTKRASATTDISNIINNNGVSIYPNPNNGTFTVSNASNLGMKVEVFNVLGSKIYSKVSTEGNMVVNLLDQAKGIYLVKVTIDGVTSTTRVTVAN